jgi:hypothetical protein
MKSVELLFIFVVATTTTGVWYLSHSIIAFILVALFWFLLGTIIDNKTSSSALKEQVEKHE